MKKILIILTIIIILIIGSLGIYKLIEFNKPKELTIEEKIINHGYSENDLKIINKLKNKNIILNYDYNEKILNIIQNENFKEENFTKYIEFSSLYEFDINDIIFVVNNNYYNKDINYTDTVISFMKQKYYVNDNLDRYLNYHTTATFETEDEKLSYIIGCINSNIDNEFYTNVKETDLSKDYLILVNKFNKLSDNYVPENLVKIDPKYGVSYELESTTYEQYKLMWEDAYKEGLILYINSPYRNYQTQSALYQRYASQDGYAAADTYSARAGYSEHQTGLAFDVTSKTTNFSSFEYSNEFKWLQENAHKYGFILRYPKGKTYLTGYVYESWHYRYVGVEAATKIKEENITFEEYYEYYVK